MNGQPFYHLRPNKSIDRSLFIQTLLGLGKVLSISDYKYTGFGSYLFDDFKLLHNVLNISSMISLERGLMEFERAEFNKPLGCIELVNEDSSAYLSNLSIDDGEKNIFWLDYVTPNELGTNLSDYATLLNLLSPNDIVRITLNANPDSLGKSSDPDRLQEVRLNQLKERVDPAYIFNDISQKDVIKKNYPVTLLKILKMATMQRFSIGYGSKFLLPLFSSVYADGQQMVTFTGIILDSKEQEDKIKEALAGYPHNNFAWDEPVRIEIPALSIREIAELNRLLPAQHDKERDPQDLLMHNFPFLFSGSQGALESYLSFYKYYPNYHHVNF